MLKSCALAHSAKLYLIFFVDFFHLFFNGMGGGRVEPIPSTAGAMKSFETNIRTMMEALKRLPHKGSFKKCVTLKREGGGVVRV